MMEEKTQAWVEAGYACVCAQSYKPYAPFVYTGPAPPLGLPVSGKHNHFPSHPRRNLGTDPDSPPHPSSSGPVHPQHSTLSPSASDHTHSRCYSLAFITYHYLPLQSIWLPPGQPSPPGSPIPGILQTRTLGWVAISFSNAGK